MSVRRFLCDEVGTSAVEFAILAPIFFATTFGVIDAGRLVWTQMSMEHAVESAARCASIQSAGCVTVSQIQSYAAAQTPGLGLPTSAFSYTSPTCGSQVAATYRYYYLSAAFPNSYSTLTAQSCIPGAPG